ncbi:MAG: peptidylprolyl isomerase [Clostridiales bacterium]|nr:peptidylprolyl isomerase [Clostridiales bacterium]
MANPVVTIEMENGKIMRAELYPDIAPNTVNNFISLIKRGFYDGLIFHRIIPGFMIQGGCPEGSGTGGPGYCISGEFRTNRFDNGLHHSRGVLSMARAQPKNSAGSQFFIMHGDAGYLDGEYAAFGKLIEGEAVLDEIVETEADGNDRPLSEQRMKSVTIDTFGTDFPEPEKV